MRTKLLIDSLIDHGNNLTIQFCANFLKISAKLLFNNYVLLQKQFLEQRW